MWLSDEFPLFQHSRIGKQGESCRGSWYQVENRMLVHLESVLMPLPVLSFKCTTPSCSDVKFTATRIGPEERPVLKNTAVVAPPAPFGSKRKRVPSWFKKNPETVASSPRDKRPLVSDSKASKTSDLPDNDPSFASKEYQPQWSSQNGLMNDPKVCKDFLDRVRELHPAEKKLFEEMTDAEFSDQMLITLANNICLNQEMQRRWIVSMNTVERQKKCLESYKDKLLSADARNRELETEVVSLKERLTSYEKEQKELKVKLDGRARKVQELNMTVDGLKNTLNAKDVQLFAKEATWTSEKNNLTSTIESLRKHVQQLEGEKSSVVDDQRWLIRKGFKHVVNKLRASDELLKLIGEVNTRASHVGFQEGLKGGYHFSKTGMLMESVSCYDPNTRNKLVRATQDFDAASFPCLEKLAACADAPLELLKSVEPDTSQAAATSN